MKRQRIPDDNARAMAGEAGHAVGGSRDDIGILGYQVGRGVQKDVEAGGDVEVGFLQGPSEGKDEGNMVVLGSGGRGGERDRSCRRNERVGGDPA